MSRFRRTRLNTLVGGLVLLTLGGCSSNLEDRLFRFTPMFRYGCSTAHVERGDAPVSQPDVAVAQGREIPVAPGVAESLLHEYADREFATQAETTTWELPYQAKRIAVALLTAAAKDDPSQLEVMMSKDARWGPPDRREIGSKPVFDQEHGPQEFFEVLRSVAARFPAKTAFNCPPMPNAAQFYVHNGAEPMWCFYMSRNSPRPDVLAVRMTVHSGTPKIDFVGMFDAPPTPEELNKMRMLRDPAPPLNPRIRRNPNLLQSPKPTMKLPPGVRVVPGHNQPGAPGAPGATKINLGPGGRPVAPPAAQPVAPTPKPN